MKAYWAKRRHRESVLYPCFLFFHLGFSAAPILMIATPPANVASLAGIVLI